MKKVLYIISILSLMLAFSSCSASWLDVSDPSEKPDDVVVSDLASARTALNGVYYMIKGTSSLNEYYGATMIYYGDIKGDLIQSTVMNDRGSWCYNLNYRPSSALNLMYIPYKVINRANLLIEKLERGDANGATEAQVADLIGQCKVARALAHFDLLRIYSNFWDSSAMGMPIVLKKESYNFMPARATVGEVFEQVVLPDLKDAIENCNSNNGLGYFNKWAAQLILARAYEYQGNNELALSTAQSLIADSPYQLWSNEAYVGGFQLESTNQGNTEALFQIMMSGNTDWTDREGISYLYNANGYNIAHSTFAFYNNLKDNYANDVRRNLLISMDEATGDNLEEGYEPGPLLDSLGRYTDSTPIWIKKYTGVKDPDDRISTIVLFRLSEAYFIAAEAALKTGDTSTAATMLNAIIKRGNPDATEVTAGNITLEKILDEKAVEFYGEGHRYFDLVRNNLDIVRYTSTENQGWGLPGLTSEAQKYSRSTYLSLYPIPQDEINANPNIKQNPGYQGAE